MKRIDHIIIRVENLHEGVAEFQDAGFQVYYGKKPEEAYNALIYLQDGSFLEIVDTTKIPWYFRLLTRAGVIRLIHSFYNRMGNFALKEGPLLDYVIYSPHIETTYERVKEKSTPMIFGKREKPNGTVVNWHCFAPKDINLPFVKSDYYPDQMSDDETDIHPNGIAAIHTMDVTFAGDLTRFKDRVVEYYQIDTSNVRVDGHCFNIQTENATVNYTQSHKHKITNVALKPLNPMLDTKLGKYGLSTTNGV